jgi:hypothetical protein
VYLEQINGEHDMARIRLEDATPAWLAQFTANELAAPYIAERFLESHLGIPVEDAIFGQDKISFATGVKLNVENLLDLASAQITTKPGNVYKFESLGVDESRGGDETPRNVIVYRVF